MASEPHGPPDAVFAGAVAVAAGVAATVWLGATLAALLTHGHTLGTGLGEGLRAAARLPAHLGDPAAAWPSAVAAHLPGPLPYWLCTAGAAAGVWVPLAVATRWWAARRVGTQPRAPLGVDARPRFATRRDLAPLAVRGAAPGRFTLGVCHRRLVATQAPTARPRRWSRHRPGDRGAVALIGPSRCGKTAAAVSGILEWTGPAVLASVKADLLAPTIAWRRRVGRCRVYDPTGYTTATSDGWSPLRAAGDFAGAQRAARALCDASPRDGIDGGADFWLARVEILLSGLLWVAAHAGAGMGDVAHWVMTQDRPTDAGPGQVEPLLRSHLDGPDRAVGRHAERAARCLESIWADDERTRSGVYATAQTAIWPWVDPGVAAASRTNDIDLDWLLGADNTAYLCAPIEDQRRLAPAFGGLLNDLINQIYRRVARTGRPLEPALLIVIDEAGNTPLRALPEYASTLAGMGVVLVTVWQSIAQITASHGRAAADVVLTNHLTKVFFSGLSDPATVGYVGQILGDAEVETRSHAGAPASLEPASESVSTTRVGIVPPHALRQMSPGHALVIHGTLPPAHLQPRPYYRVPHLRDRTRPAVARPEANVDAPRPDPARLHAALGLLAGAVADLAAGDTWRAMLDAAARFPRYSARNVLLLVAQGATGRVAGYRTWQRIPARGGGTCQVRRGATGKVILAPRYRIVELVDDTHHPEPDRQRVLTGFGTATVFDETALVAPPNLPTIEPHLLDGRAPAQVRAALEAILAGHGFSVASGDTGPANGLTRWDPPGVLIRPDLSGAQQLKTLAHEAGHVALHHPAEAGGDLTRAAKEIEAESVAYLVGRHLGLDTTEFSVPYVTGWAGGDPARLLDRADRIVAAAAGLTTGLDHCLGAPPTPWLGPADVVDLDTRRPARPQPPPLSIA